MPVVVILCGECGGNGRIEGDLCPNCDGEGTVELGSHR